MPPEQFQNMDIASSFTGLLNLYIIRILLLLIS